MEDGYYLADQHRIQQVQLTSVSMRLLAAVWERTIDPARLDATFPLYLAAASIILNRGRQTSDVLARRYYMKVASSAGFPLQPLPSAAVRSGSAPTSASVQRAAASVVAEITRTARTSLPGLPARPTGLVAPSVSILAAVPTLPVDVGPTLHVPPVPMNLAAVETSLYVTGPVVVRKQLAKGASLGAAKEIAMATSLAAAKRIMLDGGRNMLIDASRRDKNIKGWARVSDGDPCGYCAMLISRGPVYASEASASFNAHDRCGCGVRLVYRTDADGGWSDNANAYRRLWDAEANSSLSDWRKIYGQARKDPDFAATKPAAPSRVA